jgi:hypothetical protein
MARQLKAMLDVHLHTEFFTLQINVLYLTHLHVNVDYSLCT